MPRSPSPHKAGETDEPDVARERAFAVIREHGWNATSFQVLERGFSYWFGGGGESCVAHVDTGGAWVVAGAPLASEAALPRVASDFVRAARRAARRVTFFGTERRFICSGGFRHLRIGEQPVWDPKDWTAIVAATRSLREQLRRGRAKGVDVSREPGENATVEPLRGTLEALIHTWAKSKRLPPMGFLVRVDPFGFARERRLFVARRAGQMVGFASAVPVYARRGWLLEDLIRAPDAPNGTTELLVDAAMRDTASLGSVYLTLGLAPLSGHVPPLLRLIRHAGAPLYDFAGLRAFKAKFRPPSWVPIYLSFPREQSASTAVYDSLVAFAGRGLLGYGFSAFLRGTLQRPSSLH